MRCAALSSSPRRHAGLWPNAGNRFCNMYKETGADTHTGILELLTPVNLLLMHKSLINPLSTF